LTKRTNLKENEGEKKGQIKAEKRDAALSYPQRITATDGLQEEVTDSVEKMKTDKEEGTFSEEGNRLKRKTREGTVGIAVLNEK